LRPTKWPKTLDFGRDPTNKRHCAAMMSAAAHPDHKSKKNAVERHHPIRAMKRARIAPMLWRPARTHRRTATTGCTSSSVAAGARWVAGVSSDSAPKPFLRPMAGQTVPRNALFWGIEQCTCLSRKGQPEPCECTPPPPHPPSPPPPPPPPPLGRENVVTGRDFPKKRRPPRARRVPREPKVVRWPRRGCPIERTAQPSRRAKPERVQDRDNPPSMPRHCTCPRFDRDESTRSD